MSGLERGGDRRPRARSTQPRSREAFAKRLHAGACRPVAGGKRGGPQNGPHGIGAQCNRPPGTTTGRQRLELLYRTRPPQRAAISGSFQIDSHAGRERLKSPTRGPGKPALQ
jgi:hypothetical protein